MDTNDIRNLILRVKARAYDVLLDELDEMIMRAEIPTEPEVLTAPEPATEPEEVVVVPAPTPIAAPSRRRKYPGAVTTTPEPILPQPEPISLVAHDDEAPF
jgi:hypothetical protein